jgi:hypothetical protein
MGDLLQPWHMFVLFFVFLVPYTIIVVTPFWFICKKAGFAPGLSFLNLIPLPFGTLILVYILAFANWRVVPAQQAGFSPQQPPLSPQA